MRAHRTSGLCAVLAAGTFLSLAIGCGGSGGGGSGGGGGGGYGMLRRDPVTSLTFPPTSPTPGTVTDAAAFPSLASLASPVGITAAPGDPTHLYVVEQRGRIRVFENRSDVTTFSTFLDITAAVTSTMGEEGLLGLAFHPQYATNGNFYVYYIAAGGTPRNAVIARYQRSAGNPLVASTTETPLLTYSHPNTNHNGGMLAFGQDGFLYASTGDGGGAGDTQNNALNTSSLMGKILRIDVDGTPPYGIPPTNPFATSTTERKEIYAWGLRNPWRFSFDRTSGTLWCGDVGQGLNEEVDVIQNGKSYGWRAYEGNAQYSAPDTGRGPFTPPVYEYSRSTGMGNCIIGGFVYRGPTLPSLVGAYVFSDNGGGGVWAMVSDGVTASAVVQIGAVSQPSSFGEDSDGELYLCELGGSIRKFVPTTGSGGTFPPRLSDTGIFSDVASMTPETGLIPYDVNAPLWADGAIKDRLIALPGVERIGFATDGAWTFPVGTVLVKTFRLPLTAGDPSSAVRVETRVLIQSGSGWDGYCYRWRDDQSDADLLPGADTRAFTIADPAAPGGTRSQTWAFPSRTDCMRCHTAGAGRVLGVNTRQVNRNHDYSGVVDNQLRAWDHIGLFSAALGPPGAYPAHADPANTSAAVASRARAYLDANCSMCHRPGGTSQSPMDLRTLVATAQMNVVGVPPQFGDLGLSSPSIVAPGNRSNSVLWHRMRRLDTFRMPPLSTSLVDAVGEDLIGAWIDSGP